MRQREGKKARALTKNFFIVCSPRTVTVKPATCIKIDTGITLILPKMQRHSSLKNLRETKFLKFVKKQNGCGLKY